MNSTEKKLIAVFPAGLKKTAAGQWVSTDLSVEDIVLGGPVGKLRSLAAAVLIKNDPAAVILTHGDRGWEVDQEIKTRPTLAEILKQELIAAGVPAQKIIKEERSNRTYQHLEELGNFFQTTGATSIIIVTSRYHVARVKTMIETMANLAPLRQLPLTVQSAEEILIAHNPSQWQERIEQVYASSAMQQVITKEQQGVASLKVGTYEFK